MLRQLIGCQRRIVLRGYRYFTDAASQDFTEGEKKIKEVLQTKFPGHKLIHVSDISGGCGAMFEVAIEAEEFRGLRTVKQHMLVNEALKKEIGQMHGLRIHTKVPG
ncbi:bolA-like protein 3 [Ruditapes philippinarum]|uniref:bolA-like protein 3 n=1 Tax=Ruditapes philippinarum TaxID=129788 RepID=UPI00295BB8CF|nr:bolA-like protein 3 [Ruditapes philippinarum]